MWHRKDVYVQFNYKINGASTDCLIFYILDGLSLFWRSIDVAHL
jgi:hypothetical protein